MPEITLIRPVAVTVDEGFEVRTQTSERLRYHKAVLASLGVSNLSSLGAMQISGNVVPQPGLAIPLPSIFGEEVVFRSATGVAPDATGGAYGLALEPLGGRARLLSVTVASQERLHPTAVTDPFGRPVPLADMDLPSIEHLPPFDSPTTPPGSLSTIPMDIAYWVAGWIHLAANTRVVFMQPVRYLTIITERLTVGDNVLFTWERPRPVAPPQKSRTPPDKLQAPTPDGPWGVSGDAGASGVPGGPGPNGQAGPEVELWVLEMTGHPAFDLRGQGNSDIQGLPNALQGGEGGDGGKGGDGSKGRAELYDGFGFCKSGRGNGGDGGPGGSGGDGGPGGHGGHGGKFSLYAPQPVISALSSAFYVAVDGGSAGPGGIPGSGGAGGAGGQVGDHPKNCATSEPRHPGKPGPQGARGSQGPSGFPGDTYPDGIAFRTIDPDDLRRQLTEPALITLSPNRVGQGDLVTAVGRNLSPGDRVLVEGVPAATTVISDSTLTFRVPASQGGRRTVQVRQADGTLSNRATLYVLPVVSSAEQGGSITPGTTMTLVGSGFAPGAQVRVNDQNMPDASYLDPSRMSFTLIRPVGTDGAAAGEQVSLKVVLADGTPSNELALVLDTFRMVVLGDSVQWGQGLAEHQKFHSLVQAALAARMGNIGVHKTVLAHSGAIVGAGGTFLDTRTLPPIDGEVPTFYPTIMQQCDAFQDSPETVNLVLVDGGINDVSVLSLLNPFFRPTALRTRINTYCYEHMKLLLEKITDDNKFASATVVVTGYFPIVTEDTDIRLLEAKLIAFGVELAVPADGWAMSRLKANLVNLSRIFVEESRAKLRAAVDETNAALEGGPRIYFADPGFSRQNAVLASDPWLWGINPDHSPQDDLVAGSRRVACNLNRARTVFEVCEAASIGHPNPRGAQEYAEAIIAAIP